LQEDYPADAMEAYPVSRDVNGFGGQGPGLILPLSPAQQA
jgi:hypothetical protein